MISDLNKNGKSLNCFVILIQKIALFKRIYEYMTMRPNKFNF
jgi:hypothetical protein